MEKVFGARWKKMFSARWKNYLMQDGNFLYLLLDGKSICFKMEKLFGARSCNLGGKHMFNITFDWVVYPKKSTKTLIP
jgi:hypothetical protein